jgi:DNA-directed RNA polymerase subunit RPC12/RpoP
VAELHFIRLAHENPACGAGLRAIVVYKKIEDMTLIDCHECHRKISNHILYCPYCGYSTFPKQTQPINNSQTGPLPESPEKCGYIYVLSNAAFGANLFKIGKTTRHPTRRAIELFRGSSGIPKKFKVVYQREFPDCHKAEGEIHRILKRYRLGWDREFFELPLEEIKKIIDDVAGIKMIAESSSSREEQPAEKISWWAKLRSFLG